MALIFFTPTTVTSSSLKNKLNSSSSSSKLFRISNSSSWNLNFSAKFLHHKKIPSLSHKITTIPTNHPSKPLNFICRCDMNTNPNSVNTLDLDWGELKGDDVEEGDVGSPWEGAVIYRRNPSVSHVEYCTTLERLGLGRLSTEVSKSRASVMGLRVTKAVKDYPLGTPVQISMDVSRKKHKLRLDGIIRTVLTLGCNRCGEPAAQSVFTNFTLLLTEEPIEESAVINMGVIFREDKSKNSANSGEEVDDDDNTSVDLDDRLHFPAEEKEIDISKHIRDMVHVEITINAICNSECKGLCLRCGANLNNSSCNCGKQDVKEKSYGPLGNLRNQMQQNDLIN